MNAEEYAEYKDTVARYLEGIEAVSTGACPGCEKCGVSEDDDEYCVEPWFSWSSCEICGSSLGGNRYPWHGIIPPKGMHVREAMEKAQGQTIVHGECCEDCVHYLEYGCLDDQTMMEIESS